MWQIFNITVVTGYKKTVGSRRKCSNNRYVLIKGKIRNISSENVLQGSTPGSASAEPLFKTEGLVLN